MVKRLLTGGVAVAMVLSLLYVGTAKADDGRKTIASLDYVYTGEEDVEPGEECDLSSAKYGDKENGYKFTTGDAKLFASVTGTKTKTLEWAEDDVLNEETGVEEKQITTVYDMNGTDEYTPVMTSSETKNPWPSDTEAMPYFEMQFSTKGMEKIEVSAYVGATKKGPRDYQMTYAVGDSTSYTALADETAKLSLEKNKKLQQICGVLPEEAEDQELVKVRVEIVSLLQVDQSKATEEVPEVVLKAGSGEAAINHIAITGVEKASAVSTPEPTPTMTPSSTAAGNTDTSSKPSSDVEQTPVPDNSNSTVTVKKLKLNKKKLTLKKGKKYTLKLTISSTAKTAKEKKALKKAVKWSSSKKKVASVTKNGKIKAKKKGKTTITAKLRGKKVSCRVTVK